MTRKSLKDDFAQAQRKNAQASCNAAELLERLSGPAQLLTNRKQAGEDTFRLPEDGYIHLVPMGEYTAVLRNGEERLEIVQVLDQIAIESIIKGFSGELLLNYDHFAHYSDKESRAAGWIQELQQRPDGIWGRIRWTNRGREEVTGGEYRFISPEFDAADSEHLGDNRYRILKLDGAALTNSPNMKTLTPLSNRRTENQITSIMNEKLLNRLRRFFGLAEDANEEAILNAVPADTTHSQLTEQNTTLVNREQELLGQLADKDLEGLELDEERKKVLRKGLIENREATLAILNASREQPPKKIFNRESAQPPEGLKDPAKSDKALAGKIANRADQIYNDAKGSLSLAQAFLQAKEELVPSDS